MGHSGHGAQIEDLGEGWTEKARWWCIEVRGLDLDVRV